MIYKIYGKDLCEALVNGARFLIFSFDGEYALVKSDITLNKFIEQYDESSIEELYGDPLYRQPCKEC